MDKKTPFYGTPLSLNLDNKQSNDGPISSRRARLNNQQTVRDAQGRQRFHGAFTGGFSAGYHNTVDSIEGFQPCHFVSSKHKGPASSSFSHKPEDYMDEEDFGEFGIAPKKIRVTNQYSNVDESCLKSNDGTMNSVIVNLLKPKKISLGEKILDSMITQSEYKQKVSGVRIKTLSSGSYPIKSDFHGLGYKPLDNSYSLENSNLGSKHPLIAVLGGGKRLKISGVAFESGCHDDDDDDFLNSDQAYGYDDKANYKLDGTRNTCTKQKPHNEEVYLHFDPIYLPGFFLSKNVDSTLLGDNLKLKYPKPIIPRDWIMPQRANPPMLSKIICDGQEPELQLPHSSGSFTKRFIEGASSLIQSDSIESKAGLVSYSDLRACMPSGGVSVTSIVHEKTKPTLFREKLEWRPCSLLCKHFNVPVPFPQDSYVGVQNIHKGSLENIELMSTGGSAMLSDERELASVELKRSVFNVSFACSLDPRDIDRATAAQINEETDSESEPQILEVTPTNDLVEKGKKEQDLDEDQEIVIVTVPQKEPEVITLSTTSSSGSSSSSCSPVRSNADCLREDEIDENDTYGPPLPPTLKTLINLEQRHSLSSQRRKKRKRNKCKRKHKKH